MGQLNFKKPFEFHSFSDIFYCGMNKVRKTILDVFMQSPYTRIIFLKNMGQSLFNKYSKFQNFDEIYCRMIRFRNVKLSVFWQYQNTKSILRRKIWDKMVLKDFQYSKSFHQVILLRHSQTRKNEWPSTW